MKTIYITSAIFLAICAPSFGMEDLAEDQNILENEADPRTILIDQFLETFGPEELGKILEETHPELMPQWNALLQSNIDSLEDKEEAN